MDEYFYYVRDKENRPIVTVCLIKDKQGNVGKGFSICSLSEVSPEKAEGRKYAKGRALRAFKKWKKSKCSVTSPVKRREAFEALMNATRPLLPMKSFAAKCVFNPDLNEMEQLLLKAR